MLCTLLNLLQIDSSVEIILKAMVDFSDERVRWIFTQDQFDDNSHQDKCQLEHCQDKCSKVLIDDGCFWEAKDVKESYENHFSKRERDETSKSSKSINNKDLDPNNVKVVNSVDEPNGVHDQIEEDETGTNAA